jgi:carbon starvation protein
MVLIGVICFVFAFMTYGKKLEKDWGVDDSKKTPAHTMNDGVDYVPAKAPVLLGHHFASIAGAGPIAGPITAAAFGWLPVLIWVIVGSIFFGGVHDFGSLYSSVKHDSKSIGEIIKKNVGIPGKKLFNIFAFLTLALVIAVFTNLVADTFANVPASASASILFMLLAVAFGFATNRGVPLGVATIIGVIILFVSVWLGMLFPVKIAANTWKWLLLGYIFIASVTPVWVLLQPRDYLNSFLLYAMLGGGVLGIIIGNPTVQLEAFTGFQTRLGYMFPVLFVTVACGAISGFHSLVSSGTTSKQLNKESDARVVGYGGMLIEGVLAIVALLSFAVLTKEQVATAGGAGAIFAAGVGNFMTNFGIPFQVGRSFTALAFSAFALTSLDTATRLGRFIFQETFEDITGSDSTLATNRYIATLATIAAGAVLVFSGQAPVIWPIFGSANQLLAGLALLTLTVWLKNTGKDNSATKYPMFFMFAVTLTALVLLVQQNIGRGNYLLGGIGSILFVLALVLVYMSYNILTGKTTPVTGGGGPSGPYPEVKS